MNCNKVVRLCSLVTKEVQDLEIRVTEYAAEWRNKNRQPSMGVYGFPQGSTRAAIEREIITIRCHLNELRKLV